MENKNESRGHLAWLDALRFIAAFLVLFCHSRNDFFMKYNYLPAEEQGIGAFMFYTLGRLGPEAVFVFFILSGFLVGGKGLERIKSDTFKLRGYAVDRFCRIMVPLCAAVVLYMIVAPIVGQDYSMWTVVGNLLNLQCIVCEPLVSPFWSLSYEVWFYIVLFAVALAVKGKKTGFALFFVCCLVYTRMNALYLLIWLMGAVAWLCRPQKGNRLVLWGSLLLIVISLGLSQMTSATKVFNFNLPISNMQTTMLLCASMCVFCQQVILFPPRKIWACKVEGIFSKLADFSYSLYLIHRILLLVVFAFFFNKEEADLSFVCLMQYTAIVLGIMLVTYAIYYVSEKRTALVKQIIKKQLRID